MLTFRAGKFAALAISLACLVACSREQQDWRSAEASDSLEGYSKFLKDHPDSELVTEARTRFAQLSEDREWQQATQADTADAYKQFLAQHPNGKWAQEARIRVENFALGAEGAGAASANVSGNPVVGPAVPPSSAAAGLAANAPSGSVGSTTVVPAPMTSGAAAQAPAPAATAPAEIGPTALAHAPTSAPVAAGEAAQVPTSPSVSAPVPTSPPPATYGSPQPAAPTPTPSAIGTAWRSADGGANAYGVQLGAFASENAATSQWEQLTARFSAQLRGLVPHVVSAETTTGRLFRLQALVADEATARSLCDVLRKQSQACVPVLPH